MSPTVGTSFLASFAITCRRFFFATVVIDPALASGTYYVCILDAAAAPDDATDLSHAVDATHPRAFAILPVVHTLAAAEPFTLSAAAFGYPSGSGYAPATTGVVIYLSSTAPTSVTASAHLWLAQAGTT